ncbi:MAG: hypothetical protein ACJAT4_001597 [Granulosicoccus sp.]|jgi:hypothetical protein
MEMKRIKLWFFLHKEDVKGVFKISVPILILMFVFIKIPWMLQQFALGSLDSEITGVVNSVEKIKGIQESQIGGKVVTKKYTIEYQFQVREDVFKKTETLHRSSLHLNQRAKFSHLEKGDSILIRYDSDDLKKSKIKTK